MWPCAKQTTSECGRSDRIFLDASWVRSLLYLKLSTSDRITQNGVCRSVNAKCVLGPHWRSRSPLFHNKVSRHIDLFVPTTAILHADIFFFYYYSIAKLRTSPSLSLSLPLTQTHTHTLTGDQIVRTTTFGLCEHRWHTWLFACRAGTCDPITNGHRRRTRAAPQRQVWTDVIRAVRLRVDLSGH